MNESITSKTIDIDDLSIHYLESGQGETILLVHGWPTSSYLWRNIMPGLSETHRVIAIDLPGFGKSSKRLQDSYSFRYYTRVLNDFIAALKIEKVILGVHDLGGPLGLYWATRDLSRISKLIFFNTLVYPEFSWAVKLFGLSTVIPGVKQWLSSARGLAAAMKFGVSDKSKLTPEIINEYQAPFQDRTSRKTLLKTVQRLSLGGFRDISTTLPSYKGPVQIIYGAGDKILPDVANTMKRVSADLPQAKVHIIPDAGHFLQEEASPEITKVLKEFLNQ